MSAQTQPKDIFTATLENARRLRKVAPDIVKPLEDALTPLVHLYHAKYPYILEKVKKEEEKAGRSIFRTALASTLAMTLETSNTSVSVANDEKLGSAAELVKRHERCSNTFPATLLLGLNEDEVVPTIRKLEGLYCWKSEDVREVVNVLKKIEENERKRAIEKGVDPLVIDFVIAESEVIKLTTAINEALMQVTMVKYPPQAVREFLNKVVRPMIPMLVERAKKMVALADVLSAQ